MQLDTYQYTAIGSRKENEDTIKLMQPCKDYIVAVLADGLGGHGGGSKASSIAANTLVDCFNTAAFPTEEQIIQAMKKANSCILAERSNVYQMKTTVVALIVCEKWAIWAHMGDSRLYHFYNGELVDFTLDHSIPQLSVQLGEITRAQIPLHPNRSSILRVLGDENIEPECHQPVQLTQGQHSFLLCSDGLWERLQEDEIMLDLHKAKNAAQWVNSLRLRAEKRKPQDVDNNSAIALLLQV